MSKCIIPPIRFFLGGKQVTAQEVIDYHNKKTMPGSNRAKEKIGDLIIKKRKGAKAPTEID